MMNKSPGSIRWKNFVLSVSSEGMVLMELQNRGASLDEIYRLSKILDLDKLGKERHYGIMPM
ncbi:MAG: hypothetical protein WCC17_04870 [Candidatus Nitrosopolaris sp.]